MRIRSPSSLRFTLLLAAPLMLGACSSWNGKSDSLRARADLSAQTPEALYAAGMDSLKQERYADAQGFFEAVEREHPYSTWATGSSLMAAYSDYQRNRYTEAIGGLNRFIQLHPGHRDIAYAYYLRALCYYEQIVDSQRDQQGTEIAMAQLQEVVNRFPDSSYARDAALKIDLARDHLAGREMEIGRFYQARGLPQAAIGRFRRVIEQYQTTNHVPEALHRLTEIYLSLGLTDEARKTASVLGHNYPGSPWYQDSYALLVDGAPPAAGDRPGFVRRSLDWIF